MKIYLDTNQFVRVFERESEALFPVFAEACVRNRWQLVVSEGNILEVFHGIAKGADLREIRLGLERMDSLKPLWLKISGLDIIELRTSFSTYTHREEFSQIDPFLSWPEFLAALLSNRDISVMIDLAMSGASEAFYFLYRIGRLVREDRYWQSELDTASAAFRDLIEGQRRDIAFRDNFIETVLYTCSSMEAQEPHLREFAARLWDRPEVCPGFRLNFEATASPLGDRQYAWTTNRFYDQRHLIAIPYVDLFVGLDRGQRHVVTEFDNRTGNPAGLNYGDRCFARIEDAIAAQ